MQASREADAKMRELAVGVARESGLSRELADLLIEKVLIFPGNCVEIVWKTMGFSLIDDRQEASILT